MTNRTPRTETDPVDTAKREWTDGIYVGKDGRDYCGTCRMTVERCAWCDRSAYKWLEVTIVTDSDAFYGARTEGTLYLCDTHARFLSASVRDGEAKDGNGNTVELAAYTPNEDCRDCDPWA